MPSLSPWRPQLIYACVRKVPEKLLLQLRSVYVRLLRSKKGVASLRFFLHLGQILHIHVHIARLVALERLVHRLWLLGLEGVEVASTC